MISVDNEYVPEPPPETACARRIIALHCVSGEPVPQRELLQLLRLAYLRGHIDGIDVGRKMSAGEVVKQ